MFDAEAWFARDVILGRIGLPSKDEMQKDMQAWAAREEALADGGTLSLTFFQDPAAAAGNEPLDLLGYGCHSGVGEVTEATVMPAPTDQADNEAVQTLLTAAFEFHWGKCPSRVWAFPSNQLRLEAAENTADGETVVHLSLLHRLIAANQAYVTRDGEKQRVEIRPVPGGSHYRPKQQYCVVNEYGETETCYAQRSEVKHFVVPFPLYGASAVWWTSRDKVEIVEGQRALYHEAVYRRRQP
jgi:hypothetical protein